MLLPKPTPKETIIGQIFAVGALHIKSEGYKGPSGLVSPVYVDNRMLLSFPSFFYGIVSAMKEMVAKDIGEEKIDVIAGTAVGGVPWATLLSFALQKPLVFTRPKAKDHGKKRIVEGVLKNGQRVLLVEDHVISGFSSISSANALRAEGAQVSHVLSVTADGIKETEKYYAREGLILHTLVNLAEMIHYGKAKTLINTEESALVLGWLLGPHPFIDADPKPHERGK
ncbi:hypothetical protein HZB01_03030 [Candidatus Woesearchaeota archaeon]|nr:hypothetical protein [Candidatus Woesearchaeota archaeon]